MSELKLQIKLKALDNLTKPFKQIIQTSKKLDATFLQTKTTLSQLKKSHRVLRNNHDTT